MRVQQHLCYTLEDLQEYDYKKFQDCLSQNVLDSCKPIPKGRLQGIPPHDTVSKMIDAYGEESAVSLTLEILKEMNLMGIAEKLRRALAAERTASPSASSSAGAPSAGPRAAPGASVTMIAQQGGVILAPNITGSSIKTMTTNIQKDS